MGQYLQSSPEKMTSSLLALLLLAGLAASVPANLVEPATNQMVHDMMDAIESGMEDPVGDVAGKGRNFWLVSVTLTSTSTVIDTATVTTTTTTTTAASAPRKKIKKNKKNKKASRNEDY